MALTAAGQVLVDHARRVLDAVEQAEAAVALTGDEVAGTVQGRGLRQCRLEPDPTRLRPR